VEFIKIESVIAEVPGIHEFSIKSKNVDGRDKPGHDDWE
jgi:hypothetical protein